MISMKNFYKLTLLNTLFAHNYRTLTTSSVDNSTLAPLHSWFITGLSDAESSFYVKISKDKNLNLG
jgi:hypothetical protein